MKMTMAQAINACLDQELARDKKILLLGEDVGRDGGVFRVTEGLYAKYGKDRVMDTPLAESAIVGTSIGMAAMGLRPVPEIQFDGFSFLAYHQVICHMARMRNRTRGRFTLPLVLRIPYGGGIKALEHHGEGIESLYIHLPGIMVVAPSTPYEAKGLLASALESKDPVVFLEPKKLYRAYKEEVPEERYAIPLGKARIAKEGKDVSVITYGAQTPMVLEAAAELEQEGIFCEVVDLRTLNPCDWDTVAESVKKTGRAVVVHEAVKTLGFASEIIARINEKAFYHLQAAPRRVTGWDTIIPLLASEDYFFPDKNRVKAAVKEVMAEK
jgi:pyruvate dehydrogenase E1 component beta subunit